MWRKQISCALMLGVLIALAGQTAQAQITKSGEGDDAKYTLRKKHPKETTFEITQTVELQEKNDKPVDKTASLTVKVNDDSKVAYNIEPALEFAEDIEFEVDEHGFKGDTLPLQLFAILEVPFPEAAVAIDKEWEQVKFKATEDDKEEVRLTLVDEEAKTATIEVSLQSKGVYVNAEITVSTEDGTLVAANVVWEDDTKSAIFNIKKK